VTITAQGGQLQAFKDCFNSFDAINAAVRANDRPAFDAALAEADRLCTAAQQLL
jgi:hypothetical protein